MLLDPREGLRKIKTAAIVFVTVAVVVGGVSLAFLYHPQECGATAVIAAFSWALGSRGTAIKSRNAAVGRLQELETRFNAELAIRVSELVSTTVAERDTAKADLAKREKEAAVRVAQAKEKIEELTTTIKQMGDMVRRADLTGQMLVVAGLWYTVSKSKKKVAELPGGVKLDAAFYYARFAKVLAKRWPSHKWTADQIQHLLRQLTDLSDQTRWRRMMYEPVPITV